MKKILAALALLAAGPALADTTADLRACKAVSDSLQRLVCYDKLAAQLPEPAAEKPAAAPAAPAPVTAQVLPVPAISPITAPASAAEAPAPEEIHAHIVGEVSGWQLGSIFKLDNGQSWKVTQQGSIHTKAVNNPSVTLEKSWIGYWLTIEGVSAKTKVVQVVQP